MLAAQSPPAQVEDPPPVGATAPEPVEPAIESSDQTIDVGEDDVDQPIGARLRRIAETTGSFDGLEVDVREGVVFLRGVASDDEHREWLTSVARRIDGVVAVSNGMTVRESRVWDLDPAEKELRRIVRSSIRSLPSIALAAVLLALTLFVARSAGHILGHVAKARSSSQLVAALAGRVATISIVLAGLYVSLQVTGLTTIAATVLGGTSLIGLAFGFAFRDIAENFLAGVLLSVRRPFAIGDTIEVDGRTGVVQSVTGHGVRLMDFDGNIIQLTNSTVYKGTIRNYTANPKTRQSFTVGIGYDSPIAHAQSVLLATLAAHEAVLKDPEPIVLATRLGSAAVELTVYAWVDSKRFSLLRVRSALIRYSLDALTRAGISMPDDAREVVFPKPVPLMILRGDGREDARSERNVASAPAPKPLLPMGVSEREGEGSLASETEELQSQARESGTVGTEDK